MRDLLGELASPPTPLTGITAESGVDGVAFDALYASLWAALEPPLHLMKHMAYASPFFSNGASDRADFFS